ncbi:MAG: hypothetical protein LC739_09395 [Actinobacteria bacterium]|nr:hypothetical protein [Actinomycetota bacterium]
MPEVARLLAGRGAVVEHMYLDEVVTALSDLDPRHDLYVLKSGSDSALSLAGALHEAGAAILNPYPVAAASRDKILLTSVLRKAGIPIPDSFVAGSLQGLEPLLVDGPLVVKPYRGSQGRGVRVVREIMDLAAFVDGPGPFFAQRYHQPIGRDRKLYRIGSRVYGVKRVWPVQSYEDKLGEPFKVPNELHEIVLRAGDALGIELYGLDVVETEEGPIVVDFSSFPGFKGVPEAASALAELIWAGAQRAREGVALERVAG